MVLWDMTPCCSVEDGSTKILPNVANNQQTRRHIPEAYNGHQQRCANHKLQTKVVL
jgi:hypothetical protein